MRTKRKEIHQSIKEEEMGKKKENREVEDERYRVAEGKRRGERERCISIPYILPELLWSHNLTYLSELADAIN